MKSINRRSFFAILAGALVAPLFLTKEVLAEAALTPVKPTDDMAKALKYVDDNKKADKALCKAKNEPCEKQRCDSCLLYQGKAGDKLGPCQIFPGKSVTAQGWCNSWAKKA